MTKDMTRYVHNRLNQLTKVYPDEVHAWVVDHVKVYGMGFQVPLDDYLVEVK